MGCNSHLSIQAKKWAGGNWWTVVKGIDESRDYLLYGLMAGVRGDAGPIAQPRGIPEESCGEFKEWFKEYGGHTPSWLTPEEFGKAVRETIRLRLEARGDDTKWKNDPPIDKAWLIVRNLLNDFEEKYGADKVRLHFFFDN